MTDPDDPTARASLPRGTAGGGDPAMADPQAAPRRAVGRRAKIICTLGPATCEREALRGLVRAGMDVARLNCAHGDHAWHARALAGVREAAEELGREVAVLLDLAGPKIRTGALRDHRPITLQPGARIVLEHGTGEGDPTRLFTSVDLSGEVSPGEPILLNDGLFELRVVAVEGRRVVCEVVSGGELGEKKGINLPGSQLSIPSLTAQDIDDLRFGLEQGVDFIALSFVRSAADLHALRAEMRGWAEAHPEASETALSTPLIAKLEKPQAIANLDAILDCADGVMVARGDLGVELAPEKVPGLQKLIIARARRKRVPVITATQMLESMTEHPRPTRAEASDVANAVLDGTDALMLSAETASGRYPMEAVAMMSRIITEAEALEPPLTRRRREEPLSILETIAESVAHAAAKLQLTAIAVYTQSGVTARLVGAYRPPCAIYGLAADLRARRRLALYWGVTPVACPPILTTDELLDRAERQLLQLGLVQNGEIIAIVAGAPYGVSGRTNLMKILRAGET